MPDTTEPPDIEVHQVLDALELAADEVWAAELARMAGLAEYMPVRVLARNDRAYTAAQRLLDVLDPMLNAAQRERQLGADR